MFTQFVYLISLIHSNVIIVGYWITINWIYKMRLTYMNYNNRILLSKKFHNIISFPLPLLIFMILMIKKGVSKSHIYIKFLLKITNNILLFFPFKYVSGPKRI